MDETPNTAPAGADELASTNERLRSELAAENARLEGLLEQAKAATAQAAGHTDEDVRRLEHPEEFAHETITSEPPHAPQYPTSEPQTVEGG
jgi:hypothetical protein